jgi:hypothetical protein
MILENERLKRPTRNIAAISLRWVVVCLLASPGSGVIAEESNPPDFGREIRPILSNHSFNFMEPTKKLVKPICGSMIARLQSRWAQSISTI